MLTNKYFIATVVVLLLGAVGYNVWFFFLSEEDRPRSGRAVGGTAGALAGPGSGGSAAGDGGGRDGQPSRTGSEGLRPLLEGLARQAPSLRPREELDRLLRRGERLGAWGREPLARAGAPDAGRDTVERPPRRPAPDWVVTAIVVAEDRRSAVIDGRVYREGERIDGGRVLEIRSDEVVVAWRGRRVRVPLKPRR